MLLLGAVAMGSISYGRRPFFDEWRSLMKERNWLKLLRGSLNIFGNAFAMNYICNTKLMCVSPIFD